MERYPYVNKLGSSGSHFTSTNEAYLRLRYGYGSDLSDSWLEAYGCFLESNIFLREWGVGRDLLKGSVTLSGRRRHWSPDW